LRRAREEDSRLGVSAAAKEEAFGRGVACEGLGGVSSVSFIFAVFLRGTF